MKHVIGETIVSCDRRSLRLGRCQNYRQAPMISMQTSPMNNTVETTQDRRRSALAERLSALSADIIGRTSGALSEFALHDADSRCSRDNLLAYLALRDHDLQDLQMELA